MNITVKVLITAPKKIIQDTTYNVRRESEFICTLIWRKVPIIIIILALTLGWRYTIRVFTVFYQTMIMQTAKTRAKCMEECPNSRY